MDLLNALGGGPAKTAGKDFAPFNARPAKGEGETGRVFRDAFNRSGAEQGEASRVGDGLARRQAALAERFARAGAGDGSDAEGQDLGLLADAAATASPDGEGGLVLGAAFDAAAPAEDVAPTILSAEMSLKDARDGADFDAGLAPEAPIMYAGFAKVRADTAYTPDADFVRDSSDSAEVAATLPVVSGAVVQALDAEITQPAAPTADADLAPIILAGGSDPLAARFAEAPIVPLEEGAAPLPRANADVIAPVADAESGAAAEAPAAPTLGEALFAPMPDSEEQAGAALSVTPLEGEADSDAAATAPAAERIASASAEAAAPASSSSPGPSSAAPAAPAPSSAAAEPAPAAAAIAAPADVDSAAPQPSPARADAPAIDPVRSAVAASQVVAAIRADRSGSGVIDVRLDPPELGRVRIQIAFERADAVIATVSSERSETMDLLRRHGQELVRELERAGFTGVALDFAEGDAGFFAAQSGDAKTTEIAAGDDGEDASAPHADIVYLSLRENSLLDRRI